MSKALGLEAGDRPGPLRRLDVWRDLDQVARLLNVVFGDEAAAMGRSVSREFDLLRFAAPVASLHALFSDGFAGVFGGFVWEENGRIVGNVSVGKVDKSGQRWMIANVAVHPSYRRRGIARQLTQTAVDEAVRRGARAVVLDVRADNEPARTLYLSMGFQFLDCKARFRLAHALRRDWSVQPGYEICQLPPYDRSRILPLVLAATPQTVQKLLPIRTRDYAVSWWRGIGTSFVHSLCGETERIFGVQRGGELVGIAEIVVRKWSSLHRFSMLTHPDHAAHVSNTLVGRSLAGLQHYAPRPVVAEIRSGRQAEAEALRAYGFTELETLETLVYWP
ncbi:MAG: GNAT family N-acetyltransferase [Chloroflexota bacterium]|nr:MAG: GNAT family N-acetyltransferase [Chloroflexota bacterium]